MTALPLTRRPLPPPLRGRRRLGSPSAREPQAVLEDVRAGKVSVEAARELYGVVVDGTPWRVDEAATARSAGACVTVDVAIRNGRVVDGSGARRSSPTSGSTATGSSRSGEAPAATWRSTPPGSTSPRGSWTSTATRTTRCSSTRGGQRAPPGRHHRDRRQLRARVLPDPRSRARAARDLRLHAVAPAHVARRGRLLRAARGGAAGRERGEPRPERTAATRRRGARGPAGDRRGAGRRWAAPRGVARAGRLGLLDRSRVRRGAGRERGRARAALRGCARAAACTRHTRAFATPGRRPRGRGDRDGRRRRTCASRSRTSSLATGSRHPRRASSTSSGPPRAGLDVAFDMHTRLFGTTFLSTAVPPRVPSRRPARNAEGRREAVEAMASYTSILSAGDDWSRVVLLDNQLWPEYAREIASIAADRGQTAPRRSATSSPRPRRSGR